MSARLSEVARLGSVKTCTVTVDKARLYLLNAAHPDGASKAAFFARFGYSSDNLEEFLAALIDHARDNDIYLQRPTGYGEKYVIVCSLRTPDDRNPCIVTVWIDRDVGNAQLVTAYPR